MPDDVTLDGSGDVDDWLVNIDQKLTELSGELQLVKAHIVGKSYSLEDYIYG
jgi:hypothetical protein